MTTRRDFLTQAVLFGSAAATTIACADHKPLPAKKSTAARASVGGVVSVLVTPYHEDHTVDPAAMRTLCRHQAASGVDGVFVCGSTGDMGLLSSREREPLFQEAKNGLAGSKVKLYGGVTALSIFETIENTKRFAQAGVDIGVLMAPLFFTRPSQAELTAYFRQIADASPIPILLYHHVSAPTPIGIETVRAVASHPNIVGMKETDRQANRLSEILGAAKGNQFSVMQGSEAAALASFRQGGHGLMGALPGVIPEPYVRLWKLFQEKNEPELAKLELELGRLVKVFTMMPRSVSFSYFGYTLKLMLMRRGWLNNAYTRLPGFTPDPAYQEKLHAYLDEIHFPQAVPS
jgi:4-hydroxy-tetrahydrodipicolinate synthase